MCSKVIFDFFFRFLLEICFEEITFFHPHSICIDADPTNQEGSLSDISPENLQLILTLLSHDKYKQYGITEATYTQFELQFARDFPPEHCPLVLAPLIYRDNSNIPAERISSEAQSILESSVMDTSWANLIIDIGMYSHISVYKQLK